jgi:hypothetical protein
MAVESSADLTTWNIVKMYASSQESDYGLRVANASLTSSAATLRTNLDAAEPGKDLHFQRWLGSMSDESGSVTCSSTPGSSWAAGASSSATFIAKSAVKGIRFKCSNGDMMVGLSHSDSLSGDAAQRYAEIGWGVRCQAGTLHVYEVGVLVGSHGSYAASDYIEVKIDSDPGVVQYGARRIAYFLRGSKIRTSTAIPSFPLLADVAFASTGTVSAMQWVGEDLWFTPKACSLGAGASPGAEAAASARAACVASIDCDTSSA